MITIRAFQGIVLAEPVLVRRKMRITDFTKNLTFGSIVLIEIKHGSATTWAGTILGDVTFFPAFNGRHFFPITPKIVFL